MSERKAITVGEIQLRPWPFSGDATEGILGSVTLKGASGSMQLNLSPDAVATIIGIVEAEVVAAARRITE